eukprot:gene13456-biopygen20031
MSCDPRRTGDLAPGDREPGSRPGSRRQETLHRRPGSRAGNLYLLHLTSALWNQNGPLNRNIFRWFLTFTASPWLQGNRGIPAQKTPTKMSKRFPEILPPAGGAAAAARDAPHTAAVAALAPAARGGPPRPPRAGETDGSGMVREFTSGSGNGSGIFI